MQVDDWVSSYLTTSLTQHSSGRGGAAGSRSACVEERFELFDLVSFFFVEKSPGPEPHWVAEQGKVSPCFHLKISKRKGSLCMK